MTERELRNRPGENDVGFFAFPLGLVDEPERVAAFDSVEDVQPPAERDPPSRVGLDESVVFAGIERVRKGDFFAAAPSCT